MKVIYWVLMGIMWAMLLAFIGVVGLMTGPFCIVVWGFFGFCIKLQKDCNREQEQWAAKQLEEANRFEPKPIHLSAHFATDAELETAGCFKPGVPLGYSQESGRQISTPYPVHRLIFGSTGSGKSTNALMTTLLTWAASLIVIDSTAELVATTAHHRQKHGQVLIVNPMGVFRSELKDLPQVGLNPLSRSWIDPNDPFTFDIRCQKTASGIVRRDAMAREKYWADTARELATAAIMTACKYSRDADLGNIARVLRGDLTRYAKDMVQAGIDCADPWLIDTWGRWGRPGAEDIKSLNEVQENGRTEFWPFTIPPIAKCLAQDDVDFRRCVHEPMTVYIVGSMETVKETGRFIRLAASHATAQIMSERGAGSVRCLLMIDELFQLGHIDELDNNMAANRKYGLDLCLCLNDLSQLKEMYPQTFHSFVGSCGVLQVMSAGDDETSEFVSKLCGEREVITQSRTVNDNQGKLGVGDGKQVSTRRLMLPHEVRSLGSREQIMWVPGVANPVRCNRKPYFEIPELNCRARINPFFRKAI